MPCHICLLPRVSGHKQLTSRAPRSSWLILHRSSNPLGKVFQRTPLLGMIYNDFLRRFSIRGGDLAFDRIFGGSWIHAFHWRAGKASSGCLGNRDWTWRTFPGKTALTLAYCGGGGVLESVVGHESTTARVECWLGKIPLCTTRSLAWLLIRINKSYLIGGWASTVLPSPTFTENRKKKQDGRKFLFLAEDEVCPQSTKYNKEFATLPPFSESVGKIGLLQ